MAGTNLPRPPATYFSATKENEMEQLIELLQQIQELAGAGIEALEGAMGGEGAPAEGGGEAAPTAPEGEPPAE